MRKRIGDRRVRPRFEILGTLTGTLETWQRFALRNLGTGGVLAETDVPLSAGSHINGRLSLGGQSGDVRGEVRHVSTVRGIDGAVRYSVGIHWLETSRQVDDLMATSETMRPWRTGPGDEADRRKSPRFTASRDAELGRPSWSTVELVDISTNGVLFVSPLGMNVGETGELRVRLGDQSFSAQLEIRRGEERQKAKAGYRLGAAFTSLDEVSRLGLEDFIGDARH